MADQNTKRQQYQGPRQQHRSDANRRRRPEKKQEEFETKLIDLARVTRVNAGGRRFSFRATVVSGDMKGRVGVGIAKGEDVAQAVEKAKRQAQKSMIRVPILNDTIPYEVEAKFGASRVLLRPQRKGRGLVAGGAAREVCEKAGIRDVSAKFISKTHNSLNNARVTIEALKKLHLSEGQKPVDSKEKEEIKEDAVPSTPTTE